MRITWAVAAIIVGVLFVVGACTSLAAPTELAPVIIAPVIPAPVATPAPAPLAPHSMTASPMLAPQAVPFPGPNEVWLWGGEYRPNKIIVPVGTTVTWQGHDADPHDVEGDTGLFSCSLPLGVSFNYTFTERGTFGYHCECNPGMVGVVIVE